MDAIDTPNHDDLHLGRVDFGIRQMRDKIRQTLKVGGIATGVHYPTPLHRQPAFEKYRHREGQFPVSEAAAGQILSLPLYAELADEDIKRICELINGLV